MRNSSPGFTLIELSITIAVVGILALSLFPLDPFARFNLEMAAQRVEQEIRYAKELATTTNMNYGVNFLFNDSYTVYRQNVGTPATNPLTRAPLVQNIGDEYDNIFIANGVQFEFDSTGRPVIGGGSTVTVSDNTDSITIGVEENTGRINRW